MQEVEVFGLCKFLRFGDTLGESLPRHDRFDGSKRIAAVLLGLQQGLADASIKSHLCVDRFSGCLELFLVFILGCVKQLA
ncbi:hypothetical protein ALP64_200993 [Pseudomonas syringae pv. actinidiae]|nr:hypothetical protein ALP64_200993 [Pseudomonas syringae pv. actinidiae]